MNEMKSIQTKLQYPHAKYFDIAFKYTAFLTLFEN